MLSFLLPVFEVFEVILASVATVVLLAFAGITLVGSVVALFISTPIFIVFSPILIPATIATTLLATNLTAGAAFIATAVGLILWLLKFRIGMKSKHNPPPSGTPPVPGKTGGSPAPSGGGAPADKQDGGPADKQAGASGDKSGGAGDKPGGAPPGGSSAGGSPAGGSPAGGKPHAW